MLASPPQTDRAFVANYQSLGYLQADRLVLLSPKRTAEVFRVEPSRAYAFGKDPYSHTRYRFA